MVHVNPESARARAAFDQTAETMCEKLLELDRWVADSVVDLVTNTFVETSAPINHLVEAATAAGACMTTATPRTMQSTTTVSPSSLNQVRSLSLTSVCDRLNFSSVGSLWSQVQVNQQHRLN